jgi:rod shape determining protein RodA
MQKIFNKNNIGRITEETIDNDSLEGKKKEYRFDFILLAALVVLSGFGVLIIYSATKYSLPLGVSNAQYFLNRQLLFLGVCSVLFVGMLFFDYRKLKRYWIAIYILSIVILVGVLLFGYEVNFSRSWVNLGFTTLQPSELVKILMVIAVSAVLSKWKGEKKSKVSFKKVFLSLVIAFTIIAIVMLQPDLGTSILFYFTYLGILFVSGASLFYLAAIIAMTAGAVYGAFKLGIVMQYQIDRLLIFLKPEAQPEGAGYNLLQSKLAIGSGGLFGKGLFLGTQTNLSYVPEHHTDFIFSVIGEEVGFVGGFLVLIFIGLIIWRCFYISSRSSDNFGSMLSAGIGFIILSQVVINVGMTIGLMPIIGIPLPFLSYGGSNLFAMFIGLGIVENVYMRRETRKDYEIAYQDFK